jgi:hypothetical protein
VTLGNVNFPGVNGEQLVVVTFHGRKADIIKYIDAFMKVIDECDSYLLPKLVEHN